MCSPRAWTKSPPSCSGWGSTPPYTTTWSGCCWQKKPQRSTKAGACGRSFWSATLGVRGQLRAWPRALACSASPLSWRSAWIRALTRPRRGRSAGYINYYISDGIGLAIDRSPQFRGKLENVDVTKLPEMSDITSFVGHFSIDKNSGAAKEGDSGDPHYNNHDAPTPTPRKWLALLQTLPACDPVGTSV